jgi:hypothetical protein
MFVAAAFFLVAIGAAPWPAPRIRAQAQGADPVIAAGGGVEMRVDFGYGGRFRTGYWTPVRIVLTDTRPAGGPEEVRLSVVVRHGSPLTALSHATTYQRTIRLAGGSSVHTELYPLLSNAYHPVHIELRNRNGQLLTATTLDLSRRVVPEGLVLALDPSGQDWSWLTRHLTAAAPVRGQLAGLSVAYVERPQALPGLWLGYHGVSAVAVSGTFPLGALSVAQAQALADWVAAGGTLILAGGSSTEALRAPAALRQLLSAFGLSGATRRLPAGAPPTRYPPFPEDADLIVWEARPETSSVLSRSGEAVLVSHAAYGRGSIFLLTFDPAALNRMGWQGLGDLARDLLRTARPVAAGLHGAESAVWRFIRATRLPLPSRWVPGGLLLGYLAVLTFSLWWVNRKGPRPGRAVLTLCTVAAVFSLGAARITGPFADLMRHGAAELTVSVTDPTGHGVRWSFHGLRSESSDSWIVRQAGGGWTQAPTQLISLDTDDPDLTLVQVEQGVLEAHLPPRTMGRFLSLAPTKIDLQTRLTLREINYTLTVTNGTPQTIEHLYYVHPSLFAYLGPLPPGKTVEYAYPAGVHAAGRPGAQWLGTAVANDIARRGGSELNPQLPELLAALVVQRLQAGAGDRPLDDGFLLGVMQADVELSLAPQAAARATHVLLFDIALAGSAS